MTSEEMHPNDAQVHPSHQLLNSLSLPPSLSSDPNSCTRQLIFYCGTALRMTKAKRAAAQEGVSPFEVPRSQSGESV